MKKTAQEISAAVLEKIALTRPFIQQAIQRTAGKVPRMATGTGVAPQTLLSQRLSKAPRAVSKASEGAAKQIGADEAQMLTKLKAEKAMNAAMPPGTTSTLPLTERGWAGKAQSFPYRQ